MIFTREHQAEAPLLGKPYGSGLGNMGLEPISTLTAGTVLGSGALALLSNIFGGQAQSEQAKALLKAKQLELKQAQQMVQAQAAQQQYEAQASEERRKFWFSALAIGGATVVTGAVVYGLLKRKKGR